ncbi:MAG TPA: transketolase [Thermoleophilia bacterium]
MTLDELCVNTIRFLSVDAVQKANSGHPGMPLGAAPMAYALWMRHLKHNPADPQWFDRDRFVLSAGHGSMLLYSLLHLTGYDLSMAELKRFRQWGSRTPGHPERGRTPGVEVTTGPLGQGFGNGVGMAMAEAHLGARYNRPGFAVVDHYTYGIVSDGDLMEGVSSETASLAGHLGLGKLIYLYDDNRVSLSAATGLTFTEDRAARFRAYGWHTVVVDDGNDVEAVDAALTEAHGEKDRPSLIAVRTHLGYGSPHKQDTFEAHGSPLGADEVRLTKANLGWPLEPDFLVPPGALAHFRSSQGRGRAAQSAWEANLKAYIETYPGLATEFEQVMAGQLPADWEATVPRFPVEGEGMATRMASGRVIGALAAKLTNLVGGSADLDPSTFTGIAGAGDFEDRAGPGADLQGSLGGGWSYAGRNVHFGVREHGMGSILNGMAAHGGLIPFGATFLVFSDYMRPPIRLAALMGLGVIFVFTHDSIALGEDGPTHQAVEQLANLRAIPGLVVVRPCDANEVAVAWKVAVETRDRPVALVLTRQSVPVLGRAESATDGLSVAGGLAPAEGLRRGAYVLAGVPGGSPFSRPDVILVASGSEVQLALEARSRLSDQGVRASVVSMPSWELFDEQPPEYRECVLPSDVLARVVVEAGTAQGWHRYAGPKGEVISVERFGASAPGKVVMREYGFTTEHVVESALRVIRSCRNELA